ncbi:MAG TPA: hypothetical protein VEX43_14460 [Chthoniobacterales bacterium]|nr:hypothetical protein [Chthoniobacterales bacterium]
MAEKPGQEKSLHELRQQAAHSRDRLGRDLNGLRYELDFPLKFRKSFQRQTVLWISAAIVVGVIFAVMPAREKKVYVWGGGKPDRKKQGEEQKKGLIGAGLAMGALRLAATLLKPALMKYATDRMGSYAAGRGAGRGR